MTIRIEIFGEDASTALSELRGLATGLLGSVSPAAVEKARERIAESLEADDEVYGEGANLPAAAQGYGGISREPGLWKNAAPTRERGKPSPGKARRTKEEIAEDEAADKADAAKQQAAVETNLQDDVKPSISTGDERVGPDDDGQPSLFGDDSEEDAEQDAADEAAETEAAGGLEPIETLRQLIGRYAKVNGMQAAIALHADGGAIGKGITELDAKEIEKAIKKVRELLSNTAGTTAANTAAKSTATDPGPIPASLDRRAKPTKADLQAAMLRYADKFDGQSSDMSKIPATMEDCPKVFAMLFGEDVVKLSQVPEDGYAKAIAGIDEAIAKNPFKRTVKGG